MINKLQNSKMDKNDNTNKRFVERLRNIVESKRNHLDLNVKIDNIDCWEVLEDDLLEYIKSEVKSLTIDTPFYNLDNLSYFESLEVLSLTGVIYDFNGLSKLNLSKLNLDNSNLLHCCNIEVFFKSQKKTLVDLSLANCEINDLSFLGEIENLTSLNLENVDLCDFSFLYKLSSLERLNLLNTQNCQSLIAHEFENLKELAVDNFDFNFSTIEKLFPRLEILACKYVNVYPDLYALLKRGSRLQEVFGSLDTYYQWRNDLIETPKIMGFPSYTMSLIDLEGAGKGTVEVVQEFNNLTNLIEQGKLSDINHYRFTKRFYDDEFAQSSKQPHQPLN